MDSIAYCLLLGNTNGIETDYKQTMHAKREIPASNCPSFIENMLYASGSVSDASDREERAGFAVLLDNLDDRAEKYETQKVRRERKESLYHKHNRLGIRGGEWCQVDTDGVFECRGHKYQIPHDQYQYQPVDTEVGQLYDMDRILVTDDNRFFDMKYDEVKVHQL